LLLLLYTFFTLRQNYQ